MLNQIIIGGLIWLAVFWVIFWLFKSFIFDPYWRRWEVRRTIIEDNPKLANELNRNIDDLNSQYSQKVRSAQSKAEAIVMSYVDEGKRIRNEEVSKLEKELKKFISSNLDTIQRDISNLSEILETVAKNNAEQLKAFVLKE
ncbi:MAG: ATP synthase F0 subunit B [Deltaproteobacteria bacterium]|nr:ATP synthase F0 subunit B [Deltaproteobacteria bacterium]